MAVFSSSALQLALTSLVFLLVVASAQQTGYLSNSACAISCGATCPQAEQYCSNGVALPCPSGTSTSSIVNPLPTSTEYAYYPTNCTVLGVTTSNCPAGSGLIITNPFGGCYPCYIGQYNDGTSPTCKQCATGMITAYPGATSPTQCAVVCPAGTGFTNSYVGCAPCGVNTYNDGSSESCMSCGSGMVSNAGASSCSQAPAVQVQNTVTLALEIGLVGFLFLTIYLIYANHRLEQEVNHESEPIICHNQCKL